MTKSISSPFDLEIVESESRERDHHASDPDTSSDLPGTTIIESRDQIVIRCGKSSITLMSDGKIVVKGTKIISRASGENAIKGAQIKLN